MVANPQRFGREGQSRIGDQRAFSVDLGKILAVSSWTVFLSINKILKEQTTFGLMDHEAFCTIGLPPNAVDDPPPECPKTNIIKTSPNLTVKANLPLDDREDDYS
ncbi:hypothetical protein BYT27DRAFT_7252764 [Phlegmacium glaucopus]|nr:hypothetical protein BYT27DRAFT_7252764 [Phlegmacium glaucopus]